MTRRLLFCARPAHGHVNPLLPLACAARDAGHEVLFATGRDLLPRLAALGFEVAEVGISIAEGFAAAGGRPGPGRFDFELARRVFTEVLPRHTVDGLAPVVERWRPDLLVQSQWDHGAAVVAARTGVAWVRHSVSRGMDAVADSNTELWAAHGFPERPWRLETEPYIDIYPPSLQNPAVLDRPGRIPMSPTAVAPRRPTTRRPGRRAYLSLGSTTRNSATLRHAIAGLSGAGWDVVVALGAHDRAEIGRVGPRVRVEQWVDQAALLSQVGLVVHHGGSGTMVDSFAEGLPQLVLPHEADQFLNADSIESSGAGLALRPGQVTAAAVAAAVQEVDSPAHRRAAQSVALEMAALPHPADVLSTVLHLGPPGG